MPTTRFPVDDRWDAVVIDDDEKNAAVNRIARALAERAAKPDNAPPDRGDAHAHREDPH